MNQLSLVLEVKPIERTYHPFSGKDLCTVCLKALAHPIHQVRK